jgi:hypothetical protein
MPITFSKPSAYKNFNSSQFIFINNTNTNYDISNKILQNNNQNSYITNKINDILTCKIS